MLTTQQAADLLGVSRQAVQRAIKRGTMAAEKIGRDYFLTREAIEDYREKHLGKPGRK